MPIDDWDSLTTSLWNMLGMLLHSNVRVCLYWSHLKSMGNKLNVPGNQCQFWRTNQRRYYVPNIVIIINIMRIKPKKERLYAEWNITHGFSYQRQTMYEINYNGCSIKPHTSAPSHAPSTGVWPLLCTGYPIPFSTQPPRCCFKLPSSTCHTMSDTFCNCSHRMRFMVIIFIYIYRYMQREFF